MINRLNKENRRYGMKVNTSKTEVMQIRRQPIDKPPEINVKNKKLEQVKSFRYLEVVVTDDRRNEKEIKIRLKTHSITLTAL